MPRPILMVAVRPEMRTLTSASRMPGKPSTGLISAPWPTISIARPSSGTGGPLDLSVDQGALVVIIQPLDRAALDMFFTQERTFGAENTGQSRFMAATGMRVPATPIASRGSSPEKSRLPESATPSSGLPNSPCSISMRCLRARSTRNCSRKRLRTSGSASLAAAEAEHDGAARDLEPPGATALARRLRLRQQRDAIAARDAPGTA